MKALHIILGLSYLLQAQTLQEVIDYSQKNNYQLQILQEELEIVGREADIESTWSDPILKAGVNDIQSDNPLSRNVEAMQNQFVTISQTIPLSNRLALSSSVEKGRQKVIKRKEEMLRVDIAFEVRKAFIEAKNAQDNLRVLDEYISFLQRPLTLISKLSSVEKNSVESYIKTQLLQESYRVQRENWLEQIAIAKERIELIGNLKVDSFSYRVVLKNYHLIAQSKLLELLALKNPKLKMVSELKDVARKGVELAKAKEQADITVTGGYYQRFDRNDYLSFSVAMPLFIHNRQKNKRVQAMRRENIQAITYNKTRVELEQSLKIALHKIKALYQELKILKQSSQKIDILIANAKAELASGGSLLHYYELFTQRTNNHLAVNKKHLAIALNENWIEQLLGVSK